VGVPEAIACRPRWRSALEEIDRVLASGARLGCVLADAADGKTAERRPSPGERGRHHHALLCQRAFALLRHLRLGGKNRGSAQRRTTAPATPARHPPPRPAALSALQAAPRAPPPAMRIAGE
jgi:hypothetical protein